MIVCLDRLPEALFGSLLHLGEDRRSKMAMWEPSRVNSAPTGMIKGGEGGSFWEGESGLLAGRRGVLGGEN